jgi:hypothetical protein
MAMPPYDKKPVQPKPANQLEAMRHVLRASGMNASALAAIEAADAEINRQTDRK